jgi:hypothetical protein
VDELHIARIFQVLLGDTDQLVSRLECGHAQPSREEAARQLAGPAPDLKHPVAIPDVCHLACFVDERIGVGRAIAVVLDRDLVEDLAVAPCERPVAHARNVHTRLDGRRISVSQPCEHPRLGDAPVGDEQTALAGTAPSRFREHRGSRG